MNAKFKIVFLLAATLPLCIDAMAQQTTPDEQDQHAQHEHHGEHEQNQLKQEDAEQKHEHDHGTHSTGTEAKSEQETHGHEGHSVDAELHQHDTSEHSRHSSEATDHGDMHHHHHMEDGHIMDHEGTMIMGQNLDKLPSGCKAISEEVEITVRAGRKYAERFPGTVFAFDQQQWHVKPCSKVTFHFTNEDNIRHQFMMHGLPRYLYQFGMFHLEVTGPKTVSGTIIVPGSDDTLLVHCDIAQHMEKGMKAQLVIGKGKQDIPSIPGLTPYNLVDVYEAEDLPQINTSENKTEKSEVVREITTSLSKGNTQNYLMILLGALIGLFSIPFFKKIIFGKKMTVEKNEEPVTK